MKSLNNLKKENPTPPLPPYPPFYKNNSLIPQGTHSLAPLGNVSYQDKGLRLGRGTMRTVKRIIIAVFEVALVIGIVAFAMQGWLRGC